MAKNLLQLHPMLIIISVCKQDGKCFTIYGSKLLTVYTEHGRWESWFIWVRSVDVTLQCLLNSLAFGASCEWQYRRVFAFFSPWSKSHTKDDDEGLTSLNSIAYLPISISRVAREIIQSALTDPKVINLSNEHFPLRFFHFAVHRAFFIPRNSAECANDDW